MALLICDVLGAKQLNEYAKIGLMIILHSKYLFSFITSQVLQGSIPEEWHSAEVEDSLIFRRLW